MLRRCFGLLLLASVLAGGTGAAQAAGDPARGEQVYHRCQGCHSIDRNRIGPMHKGLFGRKAGSVPDFDYSDAMKNSGIVWTEATLDQFLQGPRKMVPGTKMTFVGITKLGGTPAQSKTVAQYNFPTSTLKNQTDVLRFAAGLEEGAVNAYAGAIPLFADKDLAGAGASILGSESMHWAILRYALGDQPPTMAFVGQSY